MLTQTTYATNDLSIIINNISIVIIYAYVISDCPFIA